MGGWGKKPIRDSASFPPRPGAVNRRAGAIVAGMAAIRSSARISDPSVFEKKPAPALFFDASRPAALPCL